MTWRLVVLFGLVGLANAQVGPRTRQYVRCACRASSRGFNWGTLEELKQALMDIDEERRDLVEASFTDPEITPAFIESELLRHAADHWEHCVNNFSHEECINADTSLRIRASRRSTTFCNYNNNMMVDCSKVPMLASTDSDIIMGNAEVKYIPPAPPAPKPTLPAPKPVASAPKPVPAAPKPAPPKPAPIAPKPVQSVPKPAKPVSDPTPPVSKPAPSLSKPKPRAPKPKPTVSKPVPPAPKPDVPESKPLTPTSDSLPSAPLVSKPGAGEPEEPVEPDSKPPTSATKPVPPAPELKLPESKPPSKSVPSVPKDPISSGSTSVPASNQEPKLPIEEPPKLPEASEPQPPISSDDDTAPVSTPPTPVKTPIPGTVSASTPLPPASDDVSESIPNEEDTSSKDKTIDEPELKPILSDVENLGARQQAHEGCVAVEHLSGYRKQHRVDLVRPVLCGREFCATPNHALIVDDKWTSMKELCSSGWVCIRTVKRVNNLDVFRNRRAFVGEITITPYDIRFPRVGVWVVQMFERLYYDVLYDHFYCVMATMIMISLHILRLSRMVKEDFSSA